MNKASCDADCCLSQGSFRQYHGKGCSLIDLRFEGQLTSMLFDDFLSNRQPQFCSFVSLCGKKIRKKLGLCLLIHAGSVIRHLEPDTPVGRAVSFYLNFARN